ncbi:MAG: hypothetical protein HYX55_07585 [Chloroflexi bacterium]|nr:hypothetical protein [Chloroflexota bacterium]
MHGTRSIAAPLAAFAIALVAAGCIGGPVGTVQSATAAPPTGQTPAVTPATFAPTPSLPAQSATQWGRIWDALPPWFPIPSGAKPTDTGSGSLTAELTLAAGSTAATAAGFFFTEFQKAGFAAVNHDGPLEDGSFVVTVTGGCAIEVRVVPLGDQFVARILYGAACPFE